MEDGFHSIVGFECVSKIHYYPERHIKEHRCTFTLGTLQNQPCVQIYEVAANCPKKVQFSTGHLVNVVTTRVHEGRLSIVFRDLPWATVILTHVTNHSALRQCCDVLEGILRGTFNPGSGVKTIPKTPPRSGRSLMQSPSSGRGLSVSPSTGRKPPLRFNKTPNPVLSRGAAMVAAATQNSASRTTTSFYKSGSPSLMSQEPFYPPKQHQQAKSSAKRTLVLSTRHGRGEDDGNFQPAKTFRQPPPSSPVARPPLGNLPRYQTPSYQALAKSEQKEDFEGFANLGNTCYMNAVLQSLLALDPFAEDLLNYRVVKNMPRLSLYRMMFLLLKSKRSKDTCESQRVLLKKIKAAISERAVKFGSYMQQDAHELLGQCLDQLKEEVALIEEADCPTGQTGDQDGRENEECLSPVVRNFECQLLNTITCKNCGKSTFKSELIYDFALQLPKSVLVRANDQANLQQLFNLYFSSEDVEYSCTMCGCRSATLSHKLGRLPRILILHLKRYGYNTHLSKHSKRVDNIRIPRLIDVGELGAEEVEPPPEFKGPWPRDKSALSVLASGGDDKENVSLDTFISPPQVARQQTVALTPPTSRPDSQVARPQSVAIPVLTTPPPSRPDSQVARLPLTSPRPIPLQETSLILESAEIDENETLTDANSPLFMDNKSPPSNNITASECTVMDASPSVLGKRKSTENSTSSDLQTQTANSCKVMKMDAESTKPGSHHPQQKRNPVLEDFNALFSPEVMREFETDTEIITIEDEDTKPSHASSNNHPPELTSETTPLTPPVDPTELVLIPDPTPPVLLATEPATAAVSGVNGGSAISTSVATSGDCQEVSTDGVGQEEIDEDLKQAIEASLQIQFGSYEGLNEMSEEEQLKLALQLSIAESSPEEGAFPLSPLPRVIETPTPEKNPREAYRLVSIVSHIGRGSAGGHYISDVYSVREKTWKTCNDSQISELREEDVRQRRQTTGYIFFYMHRSVLQSITHHLKS